MLTRSGRVYIYYRFIFKLIKTCIPPRSRKKRSRFRKKVSALIPIPIPILSASTVTDTEPIPNFGLTLVVRYIYTVRSGLLSSLLVGKGTPQVKNSLCICYSSATTPFQRLLYDFFLSFFHIWYPRWLTLEINFIS